MAIKMPGGTACLPFRRSCAKRRFCWRGKSRVPAFKTGLRAASVGVSVPSQDAPDGGFLTGSAEDESSPDGIEEGEEEEDEDAAEEEEKENEVEEDAEEEEETKKESGEADGAVEEERR
jgi:hypothetical protein